MLRLERPWPERPGIMGILNVTPDSFSDGGRFRLRDQALKHALLMIEAGADIIDIGGESTRPGAEPVSRQCEIDRVLPVIEAIRAASDAPISIDTRHAEVMRLAVAAGAGLINDVNALRGPQALQTASDLGVPVCLMHMQGEPRTMQSAPTYHDVVVEVGEFLRERLAACEAAGIPQSRVLVDPGFGFGKLMHHNLSLLAGLPRLSRIGPPLLVGLSRKGLIGQVLGRPVEQRLAGSLALALAAVERGASWVRVHDVEQTHDALTVLARIWAHQRTDGVACVGSCNPRVGGDSALG